MNRDETYVEVTDEGVREVERIVARLGACDAAEALEILKAQGEGW